MRRTRITVTGSLPRGRFLRLSAALLLSALLPAAAGRAAEQGGLARHLPADTIGILSIPDLGGTIGELRALPLGKIFAESEVSEFLERPLALARRQWRELSEEAMNREGLDIDSLVTTRWRAVEVAVTRLRVSPSGVEFGMAGRVDAGEGWPAAHAFLGRVVEMARKDPEFGKLEERAVGERTWTTLRPPDGEDLEGIFFWTEEGTDIHFAVGTRGSGVAADLFGRVAEGTQAPSLATDPDYVACLKRCAGSPEVFDFFRVPPIVELLCAGVEMGRATGADLPPFLTRESVRAVVAALGLDGLRAVAGASRAEGDHWVNDFFLLAPSPRRGILALGNGRADRALLGRVPEEAVSFSTGTLALGDLWDAGFAAIGGFGGEVVDTVEGALAAFEEAKGLALRRDLVASVGDRYVSYSLRSPNLFTPGESATLVPLRDPKAFERAAGALSELLSEKLAFVEVKNREVGGATIRSFAFRPGAGPEMPQGLPFNPLTLVSPSFAVKGDLLVFSLNSRGLQRALGRLDEPPAAAEGGEEGAPVGAERNAGFRRFADRVPEGAASIAYSDPRPTIETVYGITSSVLPLLGAGGDLPVDLSALPTAEVITDHLFGSVSYSVADAEGLHSRSFSSFGADAFGIAAGALLGGVGVAASRPVPAPVAATPRRAEGELLAGLVPHDLEHIRFLTNVESEEAAQWGAVAEAAYARLRDLFRTDTTTLPLVLYGYATNEGYNRFAGIFGDDHSAIYGAYFASREASQPAVATLESKDWAPLHVSHAVGHLFVRGIVGPARAGALPPWFEEGIASYVERFQDPARRTWSIDSLARQGGPGPFVGFGRGFRVAADDAQGSHKRMLQAGLVIAYFVHGADSADTDAFVEALRAVREGSREEIEKTVGALLGDERLLEQKIRAFASAAAR